MTDPHPAREDALWVDPPHEDVAVGYPVHRLACLREWTNPSGADFTDWEAACGVVSTTSGSRRWTGRFPPAFGVVTSARRKELCPACWPDRIKRK